MAQMIISAAGAVVGGYVGSFFGATAYGAQIGWAQGQPAIGLAPAATTDDAADDAGLCCRIARLHMADAPPEPAEAQ